MENIEKKKNMKIENLSHSYRVVRFDGSDAEAVFSLYQTNPQYFDAMGDIPTLESAKADLIALPPNKAIEDKYYVGFYDEAHLVAIMDLIRGFPNEQTAFIGLFMVHASQQGRGIGSKIIADVLSHLKSLGFSRCRLGYVKTNLQSKSFWFKNGFLPTGVESKQEKYTIVLMEKEI